MENSVGPFPERVDTSSHVLDQTGRCSLFANLLWYIWQGQRAHAKLYAMSRFGVAVINSATHTATEDEQLSAKRRE